MTSLSDAHVSSLVEHAQRTGARPFKAATGNWENAVEAALLDTILSLGAQVDGNYGAGVLPRLRAFKAFRGPANMMRVLANLGATGLADFVPDSDNIEKITTAATGLVQAGVNGATDVQVDAQTQREALLQTPGIPAIAWEYFIGCLNLASPTWEQLKEQWLTDFTSRATGQQHVETPLREALLNETTVQLDAIHKKLSHGMMPTFTRAQLDQAIYRAEYARSTTQS